MKILAVGGGSGGHVTPVAAVLNELARVNGEAPDVIFVCDKGFLAQSRGIMESLPFTVRVTTIASGKLRRYAHFSWWHYIRHFSIVLHNLVDGFKTIGGLIQSLGLLIRFRPDVVFAKGGFVCLPVGYAARFLKIPLVIHDSDARPGLTNKFLARFATAIGTGMPLDNYNYNPQRSQYVGVPINAAIIPTTDELQTAYRRTIGVPENVQLVVAVGGGLGSTTINSAVITAARQTDRSADVLFYNVTGVNNIEAALHQAEGLATYHPVPFVYRNMHELLGAADVVVTRASATTLQELAGLRKATIAVPAKQLGDQQRNAELFARYDAVVALRDDTLNQTLTSTLRELLADDERRDELAQNLFQFARPHAARDMAIILSKATRS